MTNFSGHGAYEQLVKHVYENGEQRTDRTGTGTYSVFGTRLEYDLLHGFPLITSKKTHFKSVLEELLWFLRGETNTSTLNASIWDSWIDENGDLGPIYGKQFRDFGGVDQIERLINDITSDPSSRRLIVSAWNPPEIPDMALAPCHVMFQVYVRDYQYLDLQVYQRSADLFLGVAFNIASYALLLHILASITGYIPGKLTWIGGDTHLYINHLEQAEELIYQRSIPEFPLLTINRRIYSVDSIDSSIFELTDYNPNPVIKAPVAV